MYLEWLALSENDEKYVLRHEWERNNGKIYERINENDRKQTEAINNLNSKVDKQTLIQEQTYESQKKQESHLAVSYTHLTLPTTPYV